MGTWGDSVECDEQEFADLLGEGLKASLVEHGGLEEDGVEVESKTFREAGLLTSDKGVVLRVSVDGVWREFQVTVVEVG